MRIFVVSIALLFLVTCCSATGSFGSLPKGSYCARVLKSDSLVLVQSSPCPWNATEGQETRLGTLSLLNSYMSKPCADNLAKYYCSLTYADQDIDVGAWSSTQRSPPDTSVCTAINTACTAADFAVIEQMQQMFGQNLEFSTGEARPEPDCATGTPNPSKYLTEDEGFHPYRVTCEPYTGSLCKGVVDYENIYVPGDLKQSEMEAQLKAAEGMFRLAPRVCGDAMIKALCSSTFMRCDTTSAKAAATGSSLDLPFPRFPCRSVCDALMTGFCRQVLDQVLAGLPDHLSYLPNILVNDTLNCKRQNMVKTCSGDTVTPTEVSIGDVFPVDNSTFDLGNPAVPVFTTDCNPSTDPTIDTWTHAVTCPRPWAKPNHANPDDGATMDLGIACGIQCPLPVFTPTEYDASEAVAMTLAIVGLLLTTEMLLTFALFKSTRRSTLIVIFTVVLWLMSWSLVGSGFVSGPQGSFANTRCKSTVEHNRFEDGGYCLFQAIFVLGGSSMAVASWLVQAIDVFLKVEFSFHKWSPLYQKIAHIMLWGWVGFYPALCITWFCVTENLGAPVAGTPWCFLLARDLSFGLYFYPVLGQSVIGAALMTAVIWRIWQSSRRTQMSVVNRKRKGWWHVYIRPLLFIFVFLWVWIWVQAFRIDLDVNEDKITRGVGQWARCVLDLLPADQCVDPKPYMNRGLWWLIQIATCGVGVWCWCLFGSKLSHYRHWKRFFLEKGARGGAQTKSQSHHKSTVSTSRAPPPVGRELSASRNLMVTAHNTSSSGLQLASSPTSTPTAAGTAV